MTTNRVIRLLCLVGVVFLISLASENALSDVKTVPAAICQGENESEEFSSYGGRSIENPSSSTTMTYRCPIVRDDLTDDDDAWSSIQIVVKDRNCDSNVSCTAYSFDKDGTFYDWESASSTSCGDNYQTLSMPGNSVVTYDKGYFEITCSVPPKYSGIASAIYSIYWNE